MVARLVGSGDALATERGYALRVLGGGVLRELGSAIRHRQLAPVQRALTIVFGLAVTTAGFVVGSASIRRGRVVAVDHP